jgi:hypothetical protein
MAGQYAKTTSVSSANTRNEIEKTLNRYGAKNFAYATTDGAAMVGFTAHDRQVRFVLPLPSEGERQFTHTPSTRTPRTKAAREAAYEQAVRQSWRALLLLVKAKLEAVASGIVTFENEFLAHVVMPDGRTVGESTKDAIAIAYSTGQVKPLLQIAA